MTDQPVLTGGCQCGAVRYALMAEPYNPHVCHCRMCQKAFGGIFGALVTAHDLEWTRGDPRRFASSNKVRRGFCAECGTPLTFETGGPIEIAVGAFDDPNAVQPIIQLNPSDKVTFFDGICTLPMRPDGAEPQAEAFKASVISFQHPDHDTEKWPAGDRR
jgi:hypothetical protein